MGLTSRVVAAGFAMLAVGGLAACSADESDSSGPYAAQFAQARESAASDFQREVLSDDRITDEEFRETRQRYIDCVNDAGMNATALPDGGYDFAPAPTVEQEVDEMQCSDETLRYVEPLYYSISVNPENEDFSVLIAECLKQQDVVDDTFGKEQWEQFESAFAAASSAQSATDSEESSSSPPSDLPTLPGGVRMDDPRVQKCVGNPLGT